MGRWLPIGIFIESIFMKWTIEQDKILLNNPHFSTKKLANKLQRTESAINNRRIRLGIHSTYVKITQYQAEKKSLDTKIKMVGKYINSYTKTEFECPVCKNIFSTMPISVWNYNTKSCGHCYDPKIGDKFGQLIITHIIPSKHNGCCIQAICKCGGTWQGKGHRIVSGHIKSCGKCGYREQIISEQKTTKNITSLTQKQKQVLDGLLLSDGSIPKGDIRTKNNDFSIGSIHKEFINNIQSQLSFSWGPINTIKAKTIFKPKKNKFIHNKKCYQLCSHADKTITNYRQKWYPKGIKIVPIDLIITPLTLLYWFYGDGSCGFINNNGLRVRFATNNFTYKECQLLVQKLHKVNLNFNIHKNNGGYELCMSKKEEVNKFFNYIGLCTLKCFQYKWKYYNKE